ncbi:hypothetical protein VKS41_003800 [Umbelopsis sp. WA50703]
MTEQTQRIIVVTGGETYVGYNLALRFLEEIEQKRSSKNFKVRVLTTQKEGLDKLQRRGAEVHVVRYEEPENIRQHLRQVELVVLTLNNREQRCQDACNVIEAANQERAQAIQFFSHIGSDKASDNCRSLLDYQRVEETLRNKYQSGKWVILRLNFIQQLFYLWSPMIEDHGKLRLNTNEDSKFAPVNMVDVLEAAVNVACGNKNMDEYSVCEQYNQKTLQLTGGQSISAREMASELSRALDGRQISFERISSQEMRQYFEEIRRDNRLQPETQSKHDKEHLIPNAKYLTETVILCIVGYLELAKENQVGQNTSDIRKINGNDPISLKNFFKDNRDQFRGH